MPPALRLNEGVLHHRWSPAEFGAHRLPPTLAAFRLGVEFPQGDGEEGLMASGARVPRTVQVHGLRMLNMDFVNSLRRKYPGMIAFYGDKILSAIFATDAEKKASSPQSTLTPSSERAETPHAMESQEKAA